MGNDGAVTNIDAVRAWIGAYRAAWESNDPAGIAALFSEDAAYFPEPWAEPWVGRDAIVKQWLARKDAPGTSTFEWQPVIVSDEVAVVEARTRYSPPAPEETYHNVWVLRLDANGQVRQFREWWMAEPPPK
jgi:uncharacterized protein (TIGR02246 family)